MAGTFVETPSRALTIEHEPTGRALTQFKPEEARKAISEIDVLAAYGAKLQDDSKLRDLAIAKLEVIVDIVDWWGRNVYEPGKNPHSQAQLENGRVRAGTSRVSVAEALQVLNYSPNAHAVYYRWSALAKAARDDTDATVEKIVDGWKMRAGMLAPPEPKEKPAEDRDLVVESIFRAYTKLDPDQRIELKERIMAFEKSYKDPFAFKAA